MNTENTKIYEILKRPRGFSQKKITKFLHTIYPLNSIMKIKINYY